MVIFLLSFLLIGSYGSDNLSVFKDKEDKTLYFFQNQTAQDETFLLEQRKLQTSDDGKIRAGQYKLSCKDSQRIGKNYIASYRAHAILNDNKIVVRPVLINNEKRCYFPNLELILNNKNFHNSNQNYDVLLNQGLKNMIVQEGCFTHLLRLCFDKNYVRIGIESTINFNDNDWQQTAWLFDDGIALQVKHELTKTILSKSIFDVTMQSFFSRIEKYDQSNFAWYEKVLRWFDNKYLYTKGFFRGKPLWITMRYSRSFRKNFLKFVCFPYALIVAIFKFKLLKVK